MTPPPVWSIDPLPRIVELAAGRPMVALDDDPTGTQTVRDVTVLTRWSPPRLHALLSSGTAAAFVLTNSRSLSGPEATRLGRSLGQALRAATATSGVTPSVVSRSDSTLRGHFPAEVDALADGLGRRDARVLLAPFFGDGERITLGGVHFIRRDGVATPVAATEFARDTVFGYGTSDLREWVAEKTAADPRPSALIDLEAIRRLGPDGVQRALEALPPRGVLVVDAEAERDIEVVALGALQAELAGLPLIARTAASYVRARAGQAPALPLSEAELERGSPGLIVVGSHVPTTTTQLTHLLAEPPTPLELHELDVAALLSDPNSSEQVSAALASAAEASIARGATPVVATSRRLERTGDAAGDLDAGAFVSATLVGVVRRLRSKPCWIMAKGGITSSAVATAGLDVSEATVIGPLLPGVPVWRCGAGSRWPGMTYVVFPGNVGGPDAVREAVARLTS